MIDKTTEYLSGVINEEVIPNVNSDLSKRCNSWLCNRLLMYQELLRLLCTYT